MDLLPPQDDADKLTTCGTEPVLKDHPCWRCGLTDWKKYKAKLDFKCGGCGAWFFEGPPWVKILSEMEGAT